MVSPTPATKKESRRPRSRAPQDRIMSSSSSSPKIAPKCLTGGQTASMFAAGLVPAIVFIPIMFKIVGAIVQHLMKMKTNPFVTVGTDGAMAVTSTGLYAHLAVFAIIMVSVLWAATAANAKKCSKTSPCM